MVCDVRLNLNVLAPTIKGERRWAAVRKEESPPTVKRRTPARGCPERGGNGTETKPAWGNAMIPKG